MIKSWPNFDSYLACFFPPFNYAISFLQLIQSTLLGDLLKLDKAVCSSLTGWKMNTRLHTSGF